VREVANGLGNLLTSGVVTIQSASAQVAQIWAHYGGIATRYGC
jgi:hypothetical protein